MQEASQFLQMLVIIEFKFPSHAAEGKIEQDEDVELKKTQSNIIVRQGVERGRGYTSSL